MPLPDDLPWVRLWARTDSDTGSETGGFSYAFDEGLRHSLPEHFPHPLERLRAVPVLVLLGEAGMGKSDALHREHEGLAVCSHGASHILDLSEFASEDRLRDRLQSVLAHRSVDHRHTLHLDSFDECRLDIRNLARLLEAELEGCGAAPHPLHLRIASRSAEWPSSLTAALQRIWGEASVEVRELRPLKRNDAAVAASAAGLDAEVFLEAVRGRDCESLAARPKTLGYLIDEHIESGTLPARRWELYENGIRKLCEEDLRRHDNAHGGNLTAGQRMHLAEELAAVMLFANRGGFYLDYHGAEDASGLLPLSILVENERPFSAPTATVDALRETLRIGGLFQRRGDGAVQFRHHSDAEFLAASFLRRWEVSPDTILGLLRDPVGQWLPPQLAGLAAWVAENVPDVRDWLIRDYPLQFLASDAPIDDATRTTLVDSLMELARARADVLSIPRHRLARLHYPGLADMLCETLSDCQADVAVRYLALDIGQACGLAAELAPSCIRVLHDGTELEGVRSKAASILCGLAESADSAAIAALLPYVRTEREDDPEGRFRSMALDALWPEHIDADTFFAALLPRRGRLIVGAHVLLPDRLEQTLRRDHLPAALGWVAGLEHGTITGDLTLRKVADTIMRRAWEHLDDECVLSAFAEAVRSSVERHEDPFNRAGRRDDEWGDPFGDTSKRRRVLDELIETSRRADDLQLPGRFLLREEDIPWLIARTQAATDSQERRMRATLVAFSYRFTGHPSITDLVLEHGGPHATVPIVELQEALGNRFNAIDPDSEDADHLRRLLRFEREAEHDEKPEEKPWDRREQIDAAKRLSETDAVEGWWRLVVALARDSDGSPVMSIPACLPDAPGWSELNTDERDRLHQLALDYLAKQAPSDLFLETPKRFTGYDTAAYAACDLIADSDGECVPEPALRQRWLPLLLCYPFAHQDNEDRRSRLLRWLLAREPSALYTELRELIMRDARDGTHGFTRAEEFDALWSQDLAQAVRELAFHESLSTESRMPLWRWLLQRKDADTAERLRVSVASGNGSPGAMYACALLLEEWPAIAWNDITTFLDENTDLAGQVVAMIADRNDRVSDTWFPLHPQKQALLYEILERHYPRHEERGLMSESYTLETKDHVRDLKGALLNWLQNAGTAASITALDYLIENFPDHEWLRRYKHQAVTIAREVGWRAPAPAELVMLFSDDRRRVVRSDEELMSVVIESIERLQDRLQGPTPMAPFLWDEASGTHKREDRLSDFVKDHLRTDLRMLGTIINREVEIRNLKDRGVGERTDLLVEAIGEEGDLHTVVIEVKGDWHAEVDTAMETQLLDRYLKGAGYRCGIYLVGWAGTKPRKFPRPQDLLGQLQQQANDLPSSDATVRGHVLDMSC